MQHQDDPESALIDKALAAVSEISERQREYEELIRAHHVEHGFMRRRFVEMATDLDFSQRVIALLTKRLERYEGPPPPPEVRHALASRGTEHQPVGVMLGDKDMTVLVPPLGDDQSGALAWWHDMWQRYTPPEGSGL